MKIRTKCAVILSMLLILAFSIAFKFDTFKKTVASQELKSLPSEIDSQKRIVPSAPIQTDRSNEQTKLEPTQNIGTKAVESVSAPDQTLEKLQSPAPNHEEGENSPQKIGLGIEEIHLLQASKLQIPANTNFEGYRSIDSDKNLVNKLTGNYVGKIYWKNSSSTGLARFEVKGQVTPEGMFEGQYDFEAYSDSDLRSKFSNPGYLGRSIRILGESPQYIIIEPNLAKGNQKLQLFFKNEGQKHYLIGNFYTSSASEDGSFQNVAFLRLEQEK